MTSLNDLALGAAQEAESHQSMALNSIDALVNRLGRIRADVLAGIDPLGSVSGDLGIVVRALDIQRDIDTMRTAARTERALRDVAEVPDRYDIELTTVDPNRRLQTIRAVRDTANVAEFTSLAQTRDLVFAVAGTPVMYCDGTRLPEIPTRVFARDVTDETAQGIVARLYAVGAQVSITPTEN